MSVLAIFTRSVRTAPYFSSNALFLLKTHHFRQLANFHFKNPITCSKRQQHEERYVAQRFVSNLRRRTLKNAFKDKSERFWKTEQKLRKRSRQLITKFDQKYKIRERVEKIIEKENIFTFPNVLCVSRIVASPYLGYLIINGDFNTAFYLILLAGVTDLLDGIIARNVKSQASKLGSFLDPLADKILISTMFVTMTCVDLVPLYLTSIIISRDIALAASAFYIRYKSLPPPKTLSRYFDASHATAQLQPLLISKINTLLQIATAGISLTAPVFGFVDHPGLVYFWGLTGTTTAITAVCYYLYAKDSYKFLRKKHSD